MRHHFCEIRIISDRLYLQTLPSDFDSDLLERQSYKEAESLATEPRKYRSSTWLVYNTPRGQCFCVFHMKLYLNVKLFTNFMPRKDSMPHTD